MALAVTSNDFGTHLGRGVSAAVTEPATDNVFQHSRATQVEVELCYDAREFRLRVRDDGQGIDPQILAGGGREGHFGRRGMRERAKLAGGKLTLWSAPDSARRSSSSSRDQRRMHRAARPRSSA
jgi:signal transduction histidine kinase